MTSSFSLYGNSGCIGNLSKPQSLPDYELKGSLRKNYQYSSIGKRWRWQSGLEAMENNVSISASLEGNISSIPNSIVKDSKMSMENGIDTSFVNHAAEAWTEMRKQWVGHQSEVSKKEPREPVIRLNRNKLRSSSYDQHLLYLLRILYQGDKVSRASNETGIVSLHSIKHTVISCSLDSFSVHVGAQHMMISCRHASVFHSQSHYLKWLIFWSTYGMKKGSTISCDFGFPLALLLENVVTFLPTKDVIT